MNQLTTKILPMLVIYLMSLFHFGCSENKSESSKMVDLTTCSIVVSNSDPIQLKSAEMLQQEIEMRTGIKWDIVKVMPVESAPVVILNSVDKLMSKPELEISKKHDSFSIHVGQANGKSTTVYLTGRDSRGTLFAAGRLIRLLELQPGKIMLPADTKIISSPKYEHRGHELGYRHLSNTYDAWTLEQYEQYIRDLIIFGTNAIHLIPNVDMNKKDSPHMKESIWNMTVQLSELIASYGLDCWLYIPLLVDINDEKVSNKSLQLRKKLFESCTSIDGVFVPGGDPGHTQPKLLMPWLKKLKIILNDVHPDAKLWLSNEDFSDEWNDELFDILANQSPNWLDGIIYGTWTRLSLQEQRAKIPKQFPIIQYVDITHCIESQYPVPDWDRAFALTLGREPINPRPNAMEIIHKVTAPSTIGFVGYSDGVNDDLNKIIWSALAWDPNLDVKLILQEYGRVFIGKSYANEIVNGMLALEKNWNGALLKNTQIESTLEIWRTLENIDDKHLKENWRFQMGLFRAYYDAYLKLKLANEVAIENQAMDILKKGDQENIETVIRNAQKILTQSELDDKSLELKGKIKELGEALFKSIGMQLSVEKYDAYNWERGAVLDALDQPLNNRNWIETQFQLILNEPNREHQIKMLEDIVNWENPGPGGFYDDLGNSKKDLHLVYPKRWEDDPGFYYSPQAEFIEIEGRKNWRLSWLSQAQTLYGEPMKMRYDNLSHDATYSLSIVYTGRFKPTLRLIANNEFEIHAPLPQPSEPKVMHFDIPADATRSGKLELEWQLIEGRGVQVAEVWLKKNHRQDYK